MGLLDHGSHALCDAANLWRHDEVLVESLECQRVTIGDVAEVSTAKALQKKGEEEQERNIEC